MKSLALRLLTALTIIGCSTAAPTVAPTPAPAPSPAPSAVTPPEGMAPAVPPTRLTEAPNNWQLLDETVDRVAGVSADRAMRELLATKQPRRTVVVAVIDGGIDTAHADLRANLWVNAKEIIGNGKDDDANGYTDDVKGWNFIGGKTEDVWHDTFEVTREHARCMRAAPATDAERQRCATIAYEYEKQRSEIEQQLQNVRSIKAALDRVIPVLKRATRSDSLTPQRVAAMRPTSPEEAQAQQFFMALAADNITPSAVNDALKAFEGQSKYALNPAYDPRPIVGDNYADPTERSYGNPNVTGPDAKHGTHVAGIIGAIRGNSTGMDGVAPAVRLMSIRTVPDGDERDKDVANAIRYAADNGANIINMSFGKAFSPFKGVVDEAVKYADAKGVLMIHAAGNDGADLSKKPNFPSPQYLDGGRPRNWIEVGASSWKGGDSLAASFSNYGREQVDLFAPGVDIFSTIPGNGYEKDSGTSMAAPVVSGVAALLMDYYPALTAADVKRILLASATRHGDQMVLRPGDGAIRTTFGSLSATGGIVNAYNALKMAEKESAVRP